MSNRAGRKMKDSQAGARERSPRERRGPHVRKRHRRPFKCVPRELLASSQLSSNRLMLEEAFVRSCNALSQADFRLPIHPSELVSRHKFAGSAIRLGKIPDNLTVITDDFANQLCQLKDRNLLA